MKNYIGTRMVNMEPMTRGEYNTFRGWDMPPNESESEAGYLIEYADGKPNDPRYVGYISWSPKVQADAAYRETLGMTFGLAVEAMKMGHSVTRAGWNGTGMFVYYVPAGSYPVVAPIAVAIYGEAGLVPYQAYLALHCTDGTVSTWAPSVSDAIADDWRIER